MSLYPLEGEVKSHAIEARPEETVEDANLTEEFIASEVLNELCTKIIQDDTTTRSAKRANRDKSLYQFASRYLEEHQESHHLLGREDANLTEESIASEVLNELCTKIIQDDTTARSAKRANRDKSLHQLASRYIRTSRKPLMAPINDLF
ncbi:hypothetical protein NW752_000355 [Fusarium irregulare]|uniref:Uncharacterized protein n=1 Tax=Fusarium irregulare TaxID=2494466 RepID=A0A9W8UF73_9HYPO|nr:hypothetical protein NW766_001478 [Fusarium irregulare]KAJ4028098.1 hypothetical protein NW752_000355 [Fusarium irregulare]